MTKEFIFPQGVSIIDSILHFRDRQVYFHGEPYKFAHVPTMCTTFAIRYTNSKCSYPTLFTTLDIVLAEKDTNEKPLIWFCGITMPGGKSLPSAYYSDWHSIEYVLNNFAVELQGSEWFIEVDDINDDYAWDRETGLVRKQKRIETVDYVWDDMDDEITGEWECAEGAIHSHDEECNCPISDYYGSDEGPDYDSAGFTEEDRKNESDLNAFESQSPEC